jgi:hypothetical protein
VQAGHISKDEDSGLISINETGREIVEEYRMSFEAFAENEKVEGSDDCDTKPQQKAAEPGEKPRVEMEELTKLWDEIRSKLFYDGSMIRIKKKDNSVAAESPGAMYIPYEGVPVASQKGMFAEKDPYESRRKRASYMRGAAGILEKLMGENKKEDSELDRHRRVLENIISDETTTAEMKIAKYAVLCGYNQNTAHLLFEALQVGIDPEMIIMFLEEDGDLFDVKVFESFISTAGLASRFETKIDFIKELLGGYYKVVIDEDGTEREYELVSKGLIDELKELFLEIDKQIRKDVDYEDNDNIAG